MNFISLSGIGRCMGLNRVISFLLISGLGFSQSIERPVKKFRLNEIITKQATSKVRYLSNNGDVTFYQKRNGSLVFSSYYKVRDILKGDNETNYYVEVSNTKKFALIEQDDQFLSGNSISRIKSIYSFRLEKGGNPTPIGQGVSPRLHLLDSWATFYSPKEKKLFVISLVNDLLSFELPINSTNDPYFIPEVFFVDNNRMLYTDVNEKGESGLLIFTRSTKKIDVLYKSEARGRRIELCKLDEDLYIGEFSRNGVEWGTQITRLRLDKKLDYAKGQILYESKTNDPGNMICFNRDKKVYFIKEYPLSADYYDYQTEVVSLNPADKEITPHTDEKFITSIFEMDGRIITPFRGTFLIVRGDPTKEDVLE